MTLLETLRRALVPYEPPVIEAQPVKAATGAGVIAYDQSVLIGTGRSDTARFMKKAQEISHKSPWVATAERIISGKLGTIPWHIEDRQGEDITDTAALADLRRLIERPNPRMTRRVLWQITSRHLGVCGNAFWYLDQRNALTGMPTAIYYINPARMTPAEDGRGNLTGWLLDADQDYAWGRGVPLQLEEVRHFVFEPPDWGHLGHGLVEAALSKIEVQRYADRFMADTFAAGGKRGGVASPKGDGAIWPKEIFDAVASGFRQVAEAPDATKRTIVTQGAVDYQFTSATPNEMRLGEILVLTRDDILGIWGVPLSAAGMAVAKGLNSGETQKYEEAALWQNAIHPRVAAMRETLQYQLIDLVNPEWQIVLEEPEFDDQEPLYKLADLAKTQPMKNRERRELLGLDPFGDDRDEEVWLPKGFVRIYPEPEEPEVVPPAPPAPAGSLADDQDEAEDDAEDVTRKASLGPLAAIRAKVEKDATPDLKDAVGRFLAAQKGDVLRRLRERAGHLLRKPKDASALLGRDWDAELAKVLVPRVTNIATEVAGEVRRVLPRAKKADPFEDAAVEFVRERGGERITGINATTRAAVLDSVQEVIEIAVAEGLGPEEAADLLTERVGSLLVWSEARADMIARTETMFAYNDAALRSYKDLDVTHVTALDGDKDAACSDRNGKTFTVDDAFSIADHPNGTLDWAPVV